MRSLTLARVKLWNRHDYPHHHHRKPQYHPGISFKQTRSPVIIDNLKREQDIQRNSLITWRWWKAYLEDNVGAGGSLKGPLAVCKLGISAVAIVQSRALHLAAVELVHMLSALRLAVKFIAAVSAIVLTVTKVGVIDTLAIAAMLGAPGTGLDLAHEGEQSLTPDDDNDNDDH